MTATLVDGVLGKIMDRVECMTSPESVAWDGPLDEDKDGRNEVDVLRDLSCNTLLVKGILLKIASVGKTRRIKDANLRKR